MTPFGYASGESFETFSTVRKFTSLYGKISKNRIFVEVIYVKIFVNSWEVSLMMRDETVLYLHAADDETSASKYQYFFLFGQEPNVFHEMTFVFSRKYTTII